MKKIKGEDMTFSNSFIVMPKDCNYMFPLIFGGAFMAQLDLCAAILANRLVKISDTVNNAVTFKADFEFSGPSYSGDIIRMVAGLLDLKKKSICIKVLAYREPRESLEKTLVATGNFVFVTRDDEMYREHELKMPLSKD